MSNEEWLEWLCREGVHLIAVDWSEQCLRSLEEQTGVKLVCLRWPPGEAIRWECEDRIREIVPQITREELNEVARLDAGLPTTKVGDLASLWKMSGWQDPRFDNMRRKALVDEFGPCFVSPMGVIYHLVPLEHCEDSEVKILPRLEEEGLFAEFNAAVIPALRKCHILCLEWTEAWGGWRVLVSREREDIVRCIFENSPPQARARFMNPSEFWIGM